MFEDGLLWTFDTEKYVESNFQKLLESKLGLSTHKKKIIQDSKSKSWSKVLRLQNDAKLYIPLMKTLEITNTLYSFSIYINAILKYNVFITRLSPSVTLKTRE